MEMRKRIVDVVSALVIMTFGLFLGALLFGGDQPSEWEEALSNAGHNPATVEQIMIYPSGAITIDSSGVDVISRSIVVMEEKNGKPYLAAIYDFRGTLLNNLPKPKIDTTTDSIGAETGVP